MTITVGGLIEANATYSDKALLILIDFEHPQLTEPFHVVRNNEIIISAWSGTATTYVPFGLDILLPDSGEDLARAKLTIDPLAIPTEPVSITGESIVLGSNILDFALVKSGTVVIRLDGIQIGADDGSGNLIGSTIDEAVSGIQYTTGSLDITLLSGSGVLTVDYEYYGSAESIVSLLRGISPVDGAVQVNIVLVYDDDLDTVQLTWPKLEWTDLGFSLTAVEGRLSSVVRLNAALQEKNRRFTPTNFPGRFT